MDVVKEDIVIVCFGYLLILLLFGSYGCLKDDVDVEILNDDGFIILFGYEMLYLDN